MTTRPDITCPETGEIFELDKFSIMKWSAQLYLIFCPRCQVYHGFRPVADDDRETAR